VQVTSPCWRKAGEDSFREDVGALRRVMEVVGFEERPGAGLALTEQRHQIDHREAVLRAESLQDLERSLRREELRPDPRRLTTTR
jgi:hypothetical protein